MDSNHQGQPCQQGQQQSRNSRQRSTNVSPTVSPAMSTNTTTNDDAFTEQSLSSHDAYTLAIMAVEEGTRQQRHSQQQQQQQQQQVEMDRLSTASSASFAQSSSRQLEVDAPQLQPEQAPLRSPLQSANTANTNNKPTTSTSQGRVVRCNSAASSDDSAADHKASSDSSLTMHRKSSSMEIRRQPTPALLMPVLETSGTDSDNVHDHDNSEDGSHMVHKGDADIHTNRELILPRTSYDDDDDDNLDNDDDEHIAGTLCGMRCIQWLCLRPRATLQAQLMLSFGSVHTIATLFVMLTCILMVYIIGQDVKDINTNTFHDLNNRIQGRTARYLAESLQEHIYPKDIVEILYHATLDRFEGYNAAELDEGTATDAYVPFWDMNAKTNRYPIQTPPLPLDWDFTDVVLATEDNRDDYLQERLDRYSSSRNAASQFDIKPIVSTSTASFFITGTCDPDETNPNMRTYMPNCTAANNDITTGGVMLPTPYTQHIHRKGKDIIPLMKAMFEFNRNVRDIGLYFASQGAGATINYPKYAINARANFTSTGCEWLSAPNPYDSSRTIGHGMKLDQFCNKKGTQLQSRAHYNPIERGWFRDMALKPEQVVVDGPYLDAWIPNSWLLSLGRAIYDRRTNDFIGCTFVSIAIEFLEDILKAARLTDNSEVSVLRWDAMGTVVASSALSIANTGSSVTASQINIGVTTEFYEELYNLIPKDGQTWDPVTMQERFENTILDTDDFSVSGYPIPPIPDEYDPKYVPAYLAIVSNAKEDILEPVENLNESVDDNLHHVIKIAVGAGVGSLCLAAIIILLVARIITAPLQDMNTTADNIVNSFGEERDQDEPVTTSGTTYTIGGAAQSGDASTTASIANGKSIFQQVQPKTTGARLLCTPTTEIELVVKEFNKMVCNFSGSLMAQSDKNKLVETPNRFFLREQFVGLYNRKNNNNNSNSSLDDIAAGYQQQQVEVNYEFLHPGPNTISEENDNNIPQSSKSTSTLVSSSAARISLEHRRHPLRSPLFLWVVILIITPLLVTTVTLSIVVVWIASNEFQESIDDARDNFLRVKLDVLRINTRLRADYIATQTSRSIHDAYILRRYASWLLFGGLKLAAEDSFQEISSTISQCSVYNFVDECPWAKENFVCDCAWHEGYPGCQDYEVSQRRKQLPYYFVEKDRNGKDGERQDTSYPNVGVTPASTVWYENIQDVPNETLLDADDPYAALNMHSTMYDRLRAISAIPIFAALQNYDPTNENGIGRFVGFEADGLSIADQGCDNSLQGMVAYWESTEENQGNVYRPDLCPIGKHGLDVRCRVWYHTGKMLANPPPGVEPRSFHLTAPYEFVDGSTAQSATFSLVNPNTEEYVGQVLLDFTTDNIFDIMNERRTPLLKNGVRALLTPGTNSSAPQIVLGSSSQNSDDIQVEFDLFSGSHYACDTSTPKCQKQAREAAKISSDMNAGKASTVRIGLFVDVDTVVDSYIAYEPVYVNSIKFVNASDFTSGINVNSKHIIYSLALGQSIEEILQPFETAEDELRRETTIGIVIVCIAIAISIVATIYTSYVVTQSITEPMLYLLDLIRCLNKNDTSHDPPTVDQNKGSKEIINVSNTMDTLYRVIKLANEAFYAGELGTAYHVLVDSLGVFRGLNNKKAIGVVCNNLGNTLLAIYREMQQSGVDVMYGITKKQLIKRGTSYYHDAIRVGEDLYDEFYAAEGWTPNCLDFMQHLSNRYFNRGMFLLTIKDDHDQPDKIMELGNRDLQISRDMDVEIVDQGIETGWGSLKREEKLFNVYLVRIRGYLLLLEMGFPDDGQAMEHLKEIQELYESEKRKLLQPRGTSELFAEVGSTGRLQQVEAEHAKYFLIKGELEKSASIAIRMLFEDEFIFVDAQLQVMKTLQLYTEQTTALGGEYARIRLGRKLEELNEALCYEIQSERVLQSSDSMTILSSLEHNQVAGMMGTSGARLSSGDHSLRSLQDYRKYDARNSQGNSTHSTVGLNASLHGGVDGGGGISNSTKSNKRWSISERSGQFVTMERF